MKDYQKKLERVDLKLERYIEEVVNDSRYKNPKAELYVMSLYLARNYYQEKINELEVKNEG